MTDKLSRLFTGASARASCRMSRSGSTRARIDSPLLVEEDGAVYQLRRWYERFLCRRSRHKTHIGLRDRGRHQRANESWNAEVEKNLKSKFRRRARRATLTDMPDDQPAVPRRRSAGPVGLATVIITIGSSRNSTARILVEVGDFDDPQRAAAVRESQPHRARPFI